MKINTLIIFAICIFLGANAMAKETSGFRFDKEEIEVQSGDSVELKLFLFTDSSKVEVDGASFSVRPDTLGNVVNNIFFASKPGKGWITAVYESYTDSVKVEVESDDQNNDSTDTDNDNGNDDQVADTTGINNIYISRVLPSGKILPAQLIKEGQTYVIGGLPSPMNILNGGEIYFPVGSLNEDIKIHIELPKYAKIVKADSDKSDSVSFRNKKVLNSVAFHVFVNDSLISPYYFQLPLEVKIPFKRGLIRKLGLDASKLSLFYASDSLELDQDGISEVVIDSAENVIKSKVAHFSNLVVAEGNGITKLADMSMPLVTMYPNPVGDFLNIKFSEELKGNKTVRVYNMMGQPFVKSVNNTSQMQLNMSSLPAGVYFIKVTNDLNEVISSKPVLKK